MASELWEIVRAEELKVGDVVFCEYHGTGITLENHEDGDPPWLWEANGGETWGFENEPIFRRVTPSDDPRVLRRVAELMAKYIDEENLLNVSIEKWIDQARKELESEGGDE